MKLSKYLLHILNFMWIPFICIFVVSPAWYILNHPKHISIIHTKQRIRVIKLFDRCHPLPLFKEWLEGFKTIQRGK